ncbi:MAG: flagellar FliJ family protein [Planctomycetes bacterium]|nr:flagellar FliJ family protein [Planctomycetota bacterium]
MAGPFRFRLEVVRKLREQAQDAERRALAGALRGSAAAEEQVAILTREWGGVGERLRAARQRERIDVGQLRGDLFYRLRLQRRLAEAGEVLAARRAELEQQRLRLADATRRLKVIEKLRERHWARYQEQVRREERGLFDEAALQAFRAESVIDLRAGATMASQGDGPC